MACSLLLLSVSLVLVAWILESWVAERVPPVLNYDGKLFFDPRKMLQPSTEQEMVAIVNQVRKDGRRLRVLGSGHSRSPLAVSDDLLVSICQLRGVVRVDKERKQVTVKGGTTLEELISVLHQHGLALSNLPAISDQTVAGTIATATHGSSVRTGNLATFVTHLRIVAGTGKVVEVSRNTNPDLFKAAAVNLGLLGVVTEVTLQCEDAYLLEETTVNHHLNYCIKHIDDLAQSAEFVKLWIEINSQTCSVYRWNRTTQQPYGRPSQPLTNIKVVIFELFQWILSYCPNFAVRAGMQTLVSTGSFLPDGLRRVDHTWRTLIVPYYAGPHPQVEVAVPHDDCSRALSDLVQLVQNEDIPVNHIIEVRFVKQDDFWLSPNYQRDSCHITQMLFSPSEHTKHVYYTGYQKAMFRYRGRPHWGKYLDLNWEKVAALYPKLKVFLAIREKMDPQNVFLNQMMTSLFEL